MAKSRNRSRDAKKRAKRKRMNKERIERKETEKRAFNSMELMKELSKLGPVIQENSEENDGPR